MNGMSDTGSTETYGDESGLDPRGAARLLAQTQRRAQQGLDYRSPWLSLLAAGAVLLALGAVWLGVRGQHPYKGPTPLSLVVLYVLVAVRIGTLIYAYRRANAGVTGRSARQTRVEGAALAVALIAVYTVMAALANAGASDGVVYGVYVITAPLIVMGAFWAGRSAAKEDRQGVSVSLAVVLVATIGAFAGPRGVWLSDAVGLCVVLLAYSAAQFWLLRAPRSDA
jgi:hypothetical protein